jgi:hypothetical protein
MNINVATQNQGVIAWRAITAANLNPAIDIRQHNNFGFTFHVIADIATEAKFEVVAAPADAANPCVPGLPQHPVAEVITCVGPWGATPNPTSEIIIPAGTKAGSICTATLPCKPDAFIQLEAVSGDTGNIEVVAVLGGPR